MTRLYKSLWLVVLAIFILSCKDDDPLPMAVADFSVDPAVIEVGLPVMFDNLSTNAARYEWDFGDGQDPITDISPSITFTSAGTATVTLRAFTQDEQMSEKSMDITVRERVLTAISVITYPITNDGVAWDDGETGVDTLADVVLLLQPAESPSPDETVLIGPLDNFTAPAGFTINLDVARIVLGNEDWVFIADDFDGVDINNATADDFERITGVQFNPISVPAIKNEAGDAGSISVQFFDSDVNGLVQLDLGFRLE